MGWPWQERGGRTSAFKAGAFGLVLLPGLWILVEIAAHDLGPRPVNEAIHQLGLWAVRLLMITLAITPLRRMFAWPRLATLRRLAGVASAVYLGLHLCAYVVDMGFDLPAVASEIVLRVYLTIGFAALAGLMVLAATSTDGMMRRLGGRRWQQLHRLVFPAAALGLIHYFMQSKLEVAEPTVVGGLYLWLIGHRLAYRALDRPPALPAWAGVLLAVAAASLTMLGEAIYFHRLAHAPIGLVLAANLSTVTGIRPGAWVLVISLTATLAGLARAALRRRPVHRPAPAE